MIHNKLKRQLKKGDTVLGTLMASATPEFVEILGISGFDFVVLDTEHGPLSVETTGNLIRAAELRNITPVTRIRENDETIILRALDIGAHGIQVPQVNQKSDAEKIVQWSKYYPVGRRGAAIPRAIDFGTRDLSDSYQHSNDESMIVIHCESEEGYQNLESILTIPQIDVVFFGPYDMTQSLGIPRQFNHPKMIEITEGILSKAKSAGKAAGIFVGNVEQAKLRARQGFQYIIIQMFETLIANTCKAIIDEFQEKSNLEI